MRFLRHHCNLNGGGQALSALQKEARAEAEHGVDRPVALLPARNRKLSDPEKAELAQDYLRGMTVYQLAKKFSVQRQTVSKHLHRMGVPMRQQGLSEEQVNRAAELYAEGLTLKQVGARLGADAGTVRLALLRRGVKMREPAARRNSGD
ncbi:helix-turn-helix domain-containing protein [Nocardia brasiliensis]|uniref:helix-turn-helix domain-containing protein n=1 Tax=Nocardia brasiliensis TaxID=37326 RepID=UPI002457CC80|nr:helix-turn-helix domain-containing protein [Nocardia brasiliensis]